MIKLFIFQCHSYVLDTTFFKLRLSMKTTTLNTYLNKVHLMRTTVKILGWAHLTKPHQPSTQVHISLCRRTVRLDSLRSKKTIDGLYAKVDPGYRTYRKSHSQ